MGKYHLVGVKGTGMAALACVLKDLGHDVSGSDVSERFFTDDILLEKNIKIDKFSKKNITKGKIYIISKAYGNDHIEVKEIIKNTFPHYYYQDFIEEYFKGFKIGVSGSHGKTTTTKILSTLLKDLGICSIVGDGSGYGDKNYKYLIFEACEYKNNFLRFNFDYLIINNIDYDHPDFFRSIDDTFKSFQKAANKSKVVIVNIDCPYASKIEHNQKYTFGFNKDANVWIDVIRRYQNHSLIVLSVFSNKYIIDVPFTEDYMLSNFMASSLVYALLGNDLNLLGEKIKKFTLPKRRMQTYKLNSNIIIDDYSHHPTEIKKCLESIKFKYPNKKLYVIFEPHTYSRTLNLEKEFQECFKDIENKYICKTFTSKRERRNPFLEKRVRNIFGDCKKYRYRNIKKILMNNKDVVLAFLGAGNIRKDILKIISENTWDYFHFVVE